MREHERRRKETPLNTVDKIGENFSSKFSQNMYNDKFIENYSSFLIKSNSRNSSLDYTMSERDSSNNIHQNNYCISIHKLSKRGIVAYSMQSFHFKLLKFFICFTVKSS